MIRRSIELTETHVSQSVEFVEAGARFRLRPFISSDGLSRAEVHAADRIGRHRKRPHLAQQRNTRVTTSVVVRDGCTAIIGRGFRAGPEWAGGGGRPV